MSNLEQDRLTLEAIGKIYCCGNHADVVKDASGMCQWCREVIEYTLSRTENCPHGHVHNCEDCDTKCQSGDARKAIRKVMSYAAPRMLFRHPIMTLRYILRKQ